jgi:hypothetical protein
MVALSDDEQEFTLQFTANVRVAKKTFAHLSLGGGGDWSLTGATDEHSLVLERQLELAEHEVGSYKSTWSGSPQVVTAERATQAAERWEEETVNQVRC